MDLNFKKVRNGSRILVIEAEELLGECMCCGLRHYHCDVDWAKDDLAAWPFLLTKRFDVVVLDLDLLRMLGEELLKNMRSKNIITPVIVMSCDNIYDRIKSLDIGATNNYVSKPFDLDELYARICALKKGRKKCCVRRNP